MRDHSRATIIRGSLLVRVSEIKTPGPPPVRPVSPTYMTTLVVGVLKTPSSKVKETSPRSIMRADFFTDGPLHGCAYCARRRVTPKTTKANMNKGLRRRLLLIPLACNAVNSRSDERRLKALMEAIRHAMGRVSTKKDGKRRRNVLKRGIM